MEIIICDIDNTLLKNGVEPLENSIGWLNARYGKYLIVLVTGRLESDRKRTIKQLSDAHIKYDQLIMNNRTVSDKSDYKEETGRFLNKKNKVAIAIDNDKKCRKAYKKAGIKLVVNPDDLSDYLIKTDVWSGTLIPRV